MNAKKHYGMVYTPEWTVGMMLDKLPTLKGVALCDPSCGDGQFLVAVAERVCKAIARSPNEAERRQYRHTLQHLTGMDIDRAALSRCRERLDAVLREHGCSPVDWRLRQTDAMERPAWSDIAGTFDAVMGNPPYVRIQHLEAYRRKRIAAAGWRLMSGCTDLYILFFEMGLELLQEGGTLIYITPNSWMKSKSGDLLRCCLRDMHQVCSITDFGEHQVFKDATTYTAITEVRKGGETLYGVSGHKCVGFKRGRPEFVEGCVFALGDQWSMFSPADLEFMDTIQQREHRLGDVADINVGIQTLADDVFIFNSGSVDIERDITRRVVKASVMKNGEDTEDRRVIYPYDEQGKLLPESQLKAKFPKAYSYLKRHKARLLARDKGTISKNKWYGFGREVAIVSGFGEKILTSPMNPAPDFQRCPDPDALFYSGYAVKPKPGVSNSALLDALNSEDMARYIRLVSRPYRNGWFSYAKSIIHSYPVPERVHTVRESALPQEVPQQVSYKPARETAWGMVRETVQEAFLPVESPTDCFWVGDAVKLLQDKVQADTVALTVTSPPYENLRDYNGYAFDAEAMLAAIYRVTRPGGVCVWVVGDKIKRGRSLVSFEHAFIARQCGFIVHDVMIYQKKNTPFMRSNAYTNCYEFMFVFSKGSPSVFNPLKVPTKRSGWETAVANKGPDAQNNKVPVELRKEKTKTNIWEYAVGLGGSTRDKIAFAHPAVFPEKLALDHILSWTNEGDIVLDPMCGSGTTCKMAAASGRHWIGIDISPEYIQLAKQRMAQFQAQCQEAQKAKTA